MVNKREVFLGALRGEIGRGIYVWGGNGETVSGMADPEGWIKKHETSAQNARRAVALYQKRAAAGVACIRAFDCSGLIYWALRQAGLLNRDLNSRGLYARCTAIDKADVRPGDLVFRHNGVKISHVGVFLGNGQTVESKDRDDGVVLSRLSASYWNRAGRYLDVNDAAEQAGEAAPASERPADPACESPADPACERPAVSRTLTVQTPYLRGDDVRALQQRLTGLGYFVGAAGADGVYGPNTAGAVHLLTSNASCCTESADADGAVWRLLGLGT